MRVFIAGLVGALVSGAVWLAAEHFLQANCFWMVMLVGVTTGVNVHRASGKTVAGATLRGALAVALTLAVIVAGRQAYAQVLKVITKPEAKAPVVDISQEDSDEAGEQGGGAAILEVEEPEPAPISLGSPPYLSPSLRDGISPWDVIWMSLAALAAYITGKGSDTPRSVASEEPSEEPAIEPQNENENDA